jgi:hypothetical protein
MILMLFSFLFYIPRVIQVARDFGNGIYHPNLSFVPESLFVFGFIVTQKINMTGLQCQLISGSDISVL